MAERRRSFCLSLCILHSLAGCLIQSSFISAFLPNDDNDLATVDAFPWVVSLQDSRYTHLTFGCILNEFWILSIASYFQNRKKVLALVGITDMNARRRTQPEYPISTILRHEGFNYMTMKNNLALLKTYTAIEFNDQVQPICFPGRKLAPGILENCWVSGWIHTAATREKMEMGVLRKLPVQEVWPCSLKRPWGTACYSSREEDDAFRCLVWPKSKALDTMTCDGGKDCLFSHLTDKDFAIRIHKAPLPLQILYCCLVVALIGGLTAFYQKKGDPGNPVMCQVKETSLWILSGILNIGGVSCIGPFLYTKLSYYSDWISKKIMKDGVDSCPIFNWQELPSAPSTVVRSELQNITLVKPPQASFPPLLQRKDQPKEQKGQAHLKPTPEKTVTFLRGEQTSGSPQMEFQENEVERAGVVDSADPVYYDYYNGEVMPISGQDRLRQAQGMVSVFCVLALLFGGF